MKEVEKREKLKAERYEEGELSSSPLDSSDTELKDTNDKGFYLRSRNIEKLRYFDWLFVFLDPKYHDSGNEKGIRSSKHKKRYRFNISKKKLAPIVFRFYCPYFSLLGLKVVISRTRNVTRIRKKSIRNLVTKVVEVRKRRKMRIVIIAVKSHPLNIIMIIDILAIVVTIATIRMKIIIGI